MSVLLLTSNLSVHTTAAIGRIAHQAYSPLEVIVVDDRYEPLGAAELRAAQPQLAVSVVRTAPSTIGMKRNGHSSEDVNIARWVYRTICRSNLTIEQARQQLETEREHPLVAEYLTFMERSNRPICTASGRIMPRERGSQLST